MVFFTYVLQQKEHYDVLVRNPWSVHCTAAWWGTQKPPTAQHLPSLPDQSWRFPQEPVLLLAPFPCFFLFIPEPEASGPSPSSSRSCGPFYQKLEAFFEQM
jgi:hypothetical protein